MDGAQTLAAASCVRTLGSRAQEAQPPTLCLPKSLVGEQTWRTPKDQELTTTTTLISDVLLRVDDSAVTFTSPQLFRLSLVCTEDQVQRHLGLLLKGTSQASVC